MTKPTSADGQINNKNKQISRSEASLQGWTNEFGAEIWVENAGKTKWRMKGCSSSSPPVSTAPSDTFGWCFTAIGGFCILNFQLKYRVCIFFSFSPNPQVPRGLLEAWSPDTAGWRHRECWTEMGSGEVQKSRLWIWFLLSGLERTEEKKEKLMTFFWTLVWWTRLAHPRAPGSAKLSCTQFPINSWSIGELWSA